MEEQLASETLDPFALFPPEVQRSVSGLIYLGQLSDDVSFCGHTFGIRTLRPAHHFAIAQVLQPFRNSVQEVNVFQALHVGMTLTHIDGDENFCPAIGPDPSLENLAKARLRYISDGDTGWYPPTIEYLWNCYVLLEAKAKNAIDELDRLSKRDLATTSSPWLDPSTVQGPSAEEMRSAILPYTESTTDS